MSCLYSYGDALYARIAALYASSSARPRRVVVVACERFVRSFARSRALEGAHARDRVVNIGSHASSDSSGVDDARDGVYGAARKLCGCWDHASGTPRPATIESRSSSLNDQNLNFFASLSFLSFAALRFCDRAWSATMSEKSSCAFSARFSAI